MLSIREIHGRIRNTRDKSPGVACCDSVSATVAGVSLTADTGGLIFENIIPQCRHSGPSSCSKPHFGQVRASLLCNDEDCNRMDVTVAQRGARRKEFREIVGLGACPTLPFVTRRRRCGQMRGRRPGKTGGVFAGIHCGFFRAEHDADGRGSFAAVERSMSDRLLESSCGVFHGGRAVLLAGLLHVVTEGLKDSEHLAI